MRGVVAASLIVALAAALSVVPYERAAAGAGQDSDVDGYLDSIEASIGTDPALTCGIDAWPPDFSGNGEVGFSDLLALAQYYGTSLARYNLDATGTVGFPDLLLLAGVYNHGCNLIRNASFETEDPLVASEPQYWEILDAGSPTKVNYPATGGHASTRAVEADLYGILGGFCMVTGNGWRTEDFINIQPSKTYELKYWAKQVVLAPTATLAYAAVISSYDSGGGFLGGVAAYSFPTGEDLYEMFSLTVVPGDGHIIPGAAKIKVHLIPQGTLPPDMCTVGLTYRRATFDEVSFTKQP